MKNPINHRTSGRHQIPILLGVVVLSLTTPEVVLAQSTDTHVVSGSFGRDTLNGGFLGGDNDCIFSPATSYIPCATIQHAVAMADRGDTIRIEDGPINECDIVVNKDITFRGIGVQRLILDAGHTCRHFEIGTAQPADVTLINLKLINGNENLGGSILVGEQGALTLEKSSLHNNIADSGGAIHNLGEATIGSDSDLEANAAENGGAVFNVGSLFISDAVLNLNEATATGGAVASMNGTVEIRDSTLSGNEANILGGAINAGNTETLIADSIVFGNLALNGFGGGIANSEGSELTLRRSTVSWNEATPGSGGGLFNQLASATIVKSTFSGNIAASGGGGIHNVHQASLISRDSSYVANSTPANGGALLDEADGLSSTTIRRSTFNDNSAFDGGGIYFLGAGGREFALINSTLSENEATRGAAIFNTGNGDFRMANSTLYGHEVQNRFDGAVWTDSTQPFGMSSSIIHNTVYPLGTGGTGPASDCGGGGPMTGTNNRADNCFIGSINLGGVTNLSTDLRDNGGYTETHRLLPGSNAIDQGAVNCLDPTNSAPLSQDQRQLTRPQDGDSDGTIRCDVGAVEYNWGVSSTPVTGVP